MTFLLGTENTKKLFTQDLKLETKIPSKFFFFFFNCDSLHARLNSHYEAWGYRKKKHNKITAYRKSV